MEELNLAAAQRAETGKGVSRRLRADGRIPCILYGDNVDKAMGLSIENRTLQKILTGHAGGNALIDLNVDGESSGRKVIFKQIDRHPVTGSVLHVDLMEVALDHKITVDVPVHLVGKAAGIAHGGMMQQESRTIKLECLPSAIPDFLEVDVTELNVGDSLHVSDVTFPEGTTAAEDGGHTIAIITTIAAEKSAAEEVEAEEGAEAEGVAEGEEGA